MQDVIIENFTSPAARKPYAVINDKTQTNGFTINLSAVPAGTYIVTVSGYYVIAGVSMQETETGCFVFSR